MKSFYNSSWHHRVTELLRSSWTSGSHLVQTTAQAGTPRVSCPGLWLYSFEYLQGWILLNFSGQTIQMLSCTGQPIATHSTPGRDSTVLSRSEGSRPSSCCQYFFWCSPEYHKPSVPQGHIAGSCSTWCSSGCALMMLNKTPRHQVTWVYIL